MSGIFISYRRSPERDVFVKLLGKKLIDFIGLDHFFLDQRSIDLGGHYPAELRQGLQKATVVIAIIHPEWVADLRPDGEDWVVEELTTALRDRKMIIPVFLDGAELRVATLPNCLRECLRPVTRAQGFSINQTSLEEDSRDLIRRLGYVIELWKPLKPAHVAPTPSRPWAGYLAAGVVAGAFIAPTLFLPDNETATEYASAAVVLMLVLLLAPLAAIGVTSLSRKPVNEGVRSLHDLPTPKFYLTVAIPLGLVVVLLTVTSITSGPVDPRAIPILVFIAGIATAWLVTTIIHQLRDEKRREDEWPQPVRTPVRPAPVRAELRRLEQQANQPASFRPTLDTCQRADWHLEHLRSAAAALATDARRSRWQWLTSDHPWELIGYALWTAGAVGLIVALLRPDVVLVVSLFAAAYAVLVGLATTELAYRRQQWQREEMVKEIRRRVGDTQVHLDILRERRG